MRFTCPKCNHELKCEDELAGNIVKCPHCKEAIDVPAEPKIEPLQVPAPASPDGVTITSIKISDRQIFVLTVKVMLSATIFLVNVFLVGFLVSFLFGGFTRWLEGR